MIRREDLKEYRRLMEDRKLMVCVASESEDIKDKIAMQEGIKLIDLKIKELMENWNK